MNGYLQCGDIMVLPKIALRPSLVTNHRQKEKIRRFIESFGTHSVLIDLGSSSRRLSRNIVNLDLFPNCNVDILSDIHSIPLKDDSIDGVIITGVFEHIEKPETVAKEIYRILKPNGLVFASVPFMQGYHPDPTDFQRYTIEGIQRLFYMFERVEVCNTRGSGSTISWLLTEFCSVLLSFNSEKAYSCLKVLFSWFSSR